ncbi:MAG: hypothetical protein OXT67_02145 [Zetaproteobacteria bacterium]|nr:hypothetical protein [Zetaproteobacteria bacterium]
MQGGQNSKYYRVQIVCVLWCSLWMLVGAPSYAAPERATRLARFAGVGVATAALCCPLWTSTGAAALPPAALRQEDGVLDQRLREAFKGRTLGYSRFTDSCMAFKQVSEDTWVCAKTYSELVDVKGIDSPGNPSCFPPHTWVYDVQGKRFEMESLQVGDAVQDAFGQPTEVIGFLHLHAGRTSTLMFDFVGEDDVVLLSASPRHLVYNGAAQARFAMDLRAEEGLRDTRGNQVPLKRIDVRPLYPQELGTLMAPLTRSGSLKVGPQGVAASCYAEFSRAGVAHMYTQFMHRLAPYEGALKPLDMYLLSWIGGHRRALPPVAL